MQTRQFHAACYAAFLLIGGIHLSAQPKAPKFKVGDQVEVDTLFTSPQSDPSKSLYWRKGTVTELYNAESEFGGYVVRIPSEGNREYRVRFRDPQWIRPATGGNAAGQQTAAPANAAPPVANGSQPAARAQSAVACPAMDYPQGNSQEAVTKRFIADQYQRNGKSRDRNLPNVAVTVHFESFKVGTTHPYRTVLANPDGDGAVDGTTVFPIKTTYTVCDDYPGFAPTGNRGEILKTEYEDMTYSCFKDATGDWRCNQTGGNQGQVQSIKK